MGRVWVRLRGVTAGGTPGYTAKALLSTPSPGKGHRPCRHSPALTLQQVGDEQRRALVTAGQLPQCQVLLDLEGEEVPVEGDRSMTRAGARFSRELGAGLSREGSAAGGWLSPRLSLRSPVFQPKGCRSVGSREEGAAPAEGCSWAPP